jgi:hypothetical protein
MKKMDYEIFVYFVIHLYSKLSDLVTKGIFTPQQSS